jgi:hypothetical protein
MILTIIIFWLFVAIVSAFIWYSMRKAEFYPRSDRSDEPPPATKTLFIGGASDIVNCRECGAPYYLHTHCNCQKRGI